MTRQEFRERLEKITNELEAFVDESCDITPGSTNQQRWANEYEVPLHIFIFTAQTFLQNMEEVQERL